MQGFSVEALSDTESVAEAESGIVRFTLLDKYLNYDISEPLKSSLREGFSEWKDKGFGVFVLDLGQVTIVDSSGVGVLISLQKATKEMNGELALVNLSPFLNKILKMMHLEEFFEIFGSEAAVLDWVAQRS